MKKSTKYENKKTAPKGCCHVDYREIMIYWLISELTITLCSQTGAAGSLVCCGVVPPKRLKIARPMCWKIFIPASIISYATFSATAAAAASAIIFFSFSIFFCFFIIVFLLCFISKHEAGIFILRSCF